MSGLEGSPPQPARLALPQEEGSPQPMFDQFMDGNVVPLLFVDLGQMSLPSNHSDWTPRPASSSVLSYLAPQSPVSPEDGFSPFGTSDSAVLKTYAPSISSGIPPPSLDSEAQTMSSSAEDWSKRSIDQRYFLETNDGEEGHMAIPYHLTRLECAFWFKKCRREFEESSRWKDHCLTHFYPKEPPTTVKCPFCPRLDGCRYLNGAEAWKARMEHVEVHHRQGGSLRASEIDTSLLRYLWNNELLEDVDYRDLILNWELRRDAFFSTYVIPNGPTEVYARPYNRREERHRAMRNVPPR